MSTGARSWHHSTSQTRPPLPPSLSPPLNIISLSLPPMTLRSAPFPSPPPPPPLPRWHLPTAPALHRTPLLRTTSTPCCWCSWSSAWCSAMCWCAWRCRGSAPCRPPPTTSSSHWPCLTCCWPRSSCPGASTWRCAHGVVSRSDRQHEQIYRKKCRNNVQWSLGLSWFSFMAHLCKFMSHASQ